MMWKLLFLLYDEQEMMLFKPRIVHPVQQVKRTVKLLTNTTVLAKFLRGQMFFFHKNVQKRHDVFGKWSKMYMYLHNI